MKKILLLFLALVCITCEQKTNTSSDSKQDSIQKYIDLAANETIDYKERVKYNDLAYSLIDLNVNDSVTRNNLYKTNVNFSKLNQYNKIKAAAEKLIDYSLKANDTIDLANGYYTLGCYFMINSENEKAIYLLFKAKKIFSKFNKITEEINCLRNISTTQYYANDYLGGINTSLKTIKLSKKTNNIKRINDSYLNIANNLSALKKNKESIKYYNKINLNNYSIENKCVVYNNIALEYLTLNEIDSSTKYCEKVLLQKDKNKLMPGHIAVAYSNLGLTFLKINKLKNLPELFNKAEEIFQKNPNFSYRNYNQIYLSQYFEKINDTKKSINAAKNALLISKRYKNPNDILLSLDQLIKVDKKNASAHAQEYIRINDSLQIAERNFRDKYAQIIFETDEISQQKEIAEKNQFIMAGLSVALFFVGILFFIIIKQRSNRLKMELEQRQQKANEEIYQLMLSQKNSNEAAKEAEKKRIALDLHDGIMNKLASTRLNLSILAEKSDETTITKCLTHISDIYAIEQEIRVIAHNLNNEVFQQENSFVSLLQDFVAVQNETTDTHFLLELDEAIVWNAISSEIKMNLFRIIQEACHNSNKHANANKIIIAFILDENNLCLSINDNGVGFDTQKSSNGIGIQNMKTRVHALGGKITINSFQNHQTSINISVPV